MHSQTYLYEVAGYAGDGLRGFYSGLGPGKLSCCREKEPGGHQYRNSRGTMLKEFPNRQPKDRRWFGDDFFDLIVWFEPMGVIVGFQLCYNVSGDEHALTWHEKAGFGHTRVDDGELHRPCKETTILIADGPFDSEAILRLFKERSRSMDEKVARFVLGKIEAYQSLANLG